MNIGIDLGGSHVGIGVVDNNGRILEKFEKDFSVEEKKELKNVAIQYIVDIVNKLKEKYEFSKVGLGVAGTVSNGVILKSVNLGIKNFDMKKELEKRIGVNVIIKNDAKCAAIAEYEFGDLKLYDNILFLTLGTGIGGAYIYEGKLLEGTNYDGFEYGHMIINKNGIECKCGKRGCFERYGSILSFKNKVIQKLNLSHDIPGPELRLVIDNSKEEIKDIINEYIDDLSIGISNLVNIFEPDCIVIGGGFARYDYLLLDKLHEKLLQSNLLFNNRNEIIIKTAKLGNDAGIIGASKLV